MKRYIKASKKSNLELLKSFVGKDEWILVHLVNFYSQKVYEVALIKINKIYGDVFYNKLKLDFNYHHDYDNALDYVAANYTSINSALQTEARTLKDCIKIFPPVESYTTEEIQFAIDESNREADI